MATRKPKARKAGAPAKAKAKARAKAPAKGKAPAKAKAPVGKGRALAKPTVPPRTKAKATAPAASGKAKKSEPVSYVKVFLHDRGQDVESAWCEPAGRDGSRALFRLVNVPFLHAKPTFGDVIVARRDDNYGGNWAWNQNGAEYDAIVERLHEDGGRYTLIVEYTMAEEADFDALCRPVRALHDIVPEGCFGPRGPKPGRLFLAAPAALTPPAVLDALAQAASGFAFTLVHPV